MGQKNTKKESIQERKMEGLLAYNPVLLALIATLFTWFVTALGAAMVFFFKSINEKILNLDVGFCRRSDDCRQLLVVVGTGNRNERNHDVAPLDAGPYWFFRGRAFLFLVDKILPHLHMGLSIDKAEGVKTSWERSVLLVLAITLHNIPEGLAVGVAFGALGIHPDLGTLAGAITLALGIGLQNFPRERPCRYRFVVKDFHDSKAFTYGQLSGVVEPISAVIGAFLVSTITPLLPYALSFAAGAMIFVVVEELIPESQTGNETDFSDHRRSFGICRDDGIGSCFRIKNIA